MVSPTKYITNIGSLKRYSDRLEARKILQEVAKAVAPLMHEKGFKVGTLCEMYPKNGNLLGLNVNKGQKILLRLRFASNPLLFLPLNDILGTMLHELTHNVYGAHDVQFYRFLDNLTLRFEQLQTQGTSYVCEEQALGSRVGSGMAAVRNKRLLALSKPKFRAEARRLGGRNHNGETPIRELVLEAAERRLKDSKWCGKGGEESDMGGEVEIIEVGGEVTETDIEVRSETEEATEAEEGSKRRRTTETCSSKSRKNYRDGNAMAEKRPAKNSQNLPIELEANDSGSNGLTPTPTTSSDAAPVYIVID